MREYPGWKKSTLGFNHHGFVKGTYVMNDRGQIFQIKREFAGGVIVVEVAEDHSVYISITPPAGPEKIVYLPEGGACLLSEMLDELIRDTA